MSAKLLIVLVLSSLFIGSSATSIDFKKQYFESLELETMPLVRAVDRINDIHFSKTGGNPEFKILMEDPLDMDDQVSLVLTNADLDLLLKVLLAGTGYHFSTSDQYIIIKAASNISERTAIPEPGQTSASICLIEVHPSSSNDLSTHSWGGSGTGFLCVINNTKFLVTNVHVIEAANSLNEISVRTKDNIEVKLTDGYVAQDRDVVIFRHEENPNLKYLNLSQRVSKIERNSPVYIYGYPLGGGVLRKSEGTLDGVGSTLLELNLSAFSGNSGGPVFDAINSEVVGVLTKAEIVPDDAFTSLARAKLSNPIRDDIRIYGTRLDTISTTNWEPMMWSVWKTEKERVHYHVNALLALYSLVSSNYSPGTLITDEKYLVNDADLWRAYKKCADDYSAALARRDAVLRDSALKSFIDYIEINFRPGGPRWNDLSRPWRYEWFVSIKSGNTSWDLVENIKRLYRELHKEWSDMSRRWEVN